MPVETLLQQDDLSFLRGLRDGKFPAPPITQTLGFTLAEVDHGRAVFTGEPQARHYNPIGTVHGGAIATLLDSVMGCAVHTTLPKGRAYTSLEIKVNFLRAVTVETGAISAEGRAVHVGRRSAVAEGKAFDSAGKLVATASTTCLVFDF